MTASPGNFTAQDFEKLGAFYLGRKHDLQTGQTGAETILYDARDLTTHAVCVGMTGSGKTGLCTCLLEEALLDGVPAIAVDVKGDLSNLLLGFPDLRPADFEPWVDPAEARRKGLSLAEFAATTAELWRSGLAEWGEDGERIRRLQDSCEMRIFTPGSDAGLPLSIIKSFDAPSTDITGDRDALRERLVTVVGGLLGLLGIDADPLKSREHILLSTILGEAWERGANMSLAELIVAIQDPPVSKVGVFELDVFYPAKDRLELAMALNNLLASPTFAAWLEGEPLDIGSLLWGPGGKPRLSILYIAHLSEQERMFFVSLLLNEVLSWVRAQSGTSSLRAILYMDEIFGYFPPVANPPTKPPMLSLLKQARAFGLGVVLSTQNPVDLDYKGLANTGTWLIGRLQTERDKARVLEGLEGASASAGAGFDRQVMERTLAGLGKRVFLLHNVHEDEPVIFQTRWAMSYLRGPMTRDQVRLLMEPQLDQAETPVAAQDAEQQYAGPEPEPEARSGEPPVGDEVPQLIVPHLAGEGPITYLPVLTAGARLHFSDSRSGVEEWRSIELQGRIGAGGDPWDGAQRLRAAYGEAAGPAAGAQFGDAGREAADPGNYDAWGKMLASRLYGSELLKVWKCRELKLASESGESSDDFARRVIQGAREARDDAMDKLRSDCARKEQRCRDRISRAERELQEEQADYAATKMQSAFDIGATVLGTILGRKKLSMGNLDRARTAGRSVGRASRKRGSVKTAQQDLVEARHELTELELELQDKLAELRRKWDPANLSVTSRDLKPRKSDIAISGPYLTWLPHRPGAGGQLEPAYHQP